ncbi:hypothetical protein [Chitinophaga polysaccharea]|uniref:hypothetical protein n=1 Tax=Chitinophaga polysaccharea TaxID=1293035 RepID=UPI0021B0137E|nr:hypothetical protein [Chitinophaga polysaccharea]
MLPLNGPQREAVVAQTVDLGNASIPVGIDGAHHNMIRKVYKDGFITAYGRIMQLSAGLAFLGGLMGFLFIRKRPATA